MSYSVLKLECDTTDNSVGIYSKIDSKSVDVIEFFFLFGIATSQYISIHCCNCHLPLLYVNMILFYRRKNSFALHHKRS